MNQLAIRHAGGRPTKYKPEILRKAREYLSNYEDQGDKVPSISGLAIALNIHRDTIHTWIQDEDKKEFSDIITSLMVTQEHALINNGLSSKFNSNITKLLLGKHGYHDKQEVTGQVTFSKVERAIIDVTPEITDS